MKERKDRKTTLKKKLEPSAALYATVMASQRTLNALEDMRNETLKGGGVELFEEQHRRGKLTARERIELLLDEGSFEEFDLLKTGRGGAFGKEKTYPGDGVVTGHGTIDGRFGQQGFGR